MRIFSPVYLVRSSETCWKCKCPAEVVALAVTRFVDEDPLCEEGEPVLLHNIESLPSDLLGAVTARHPGFEKRFSKTADLSYYVNVCPCGAHFGDFYLFSEPGGAFFPDNETQAASLTIEELPIQGEWEIDATYSVGPGGDIFGRGRRLPDKG